MYWLIIADNANTPVDKSLFTGVLPSGLPRLVACPNCRTNMYPVFSISKDLLPFTLDERFFVDDLLTLDVCPRCTHSLRKYEVKFGESRVVSGGYISDHEVSTPIDEPYKCRAVSLQEVSEEEIVKIHYDSYLTRKLAPGVYHQLAGKPLKEEREPISGNCDSCGTELQFIATVDYDDLNVPLYQDGSPFCLIIGDMKSLNVRCCHVCVKLVYSITE